MNIFKTNSNSGVKEIKITDITPEYAQKLLGCNTNNRNIRKSRVKMYANDMKKGNWRSNGEPIVIGDDGILRQGQHRLTAIVEANITLKNQVIMLVSSDEANMYDTNLTRRTVDIMKFENIDDCAIKNGIIISGITYCLKLRDKTTAPSKIEIIDTAIKYQDACRFIYYNLVTKTVMVGVRRASVIAALICAYISNYDTEKLKSFLDCLSIGIPKNSNDIGVIKLRDYLINQKSGGLTIQNDVFYRTQNHLKAYENNRSLTRCCTASKLLYDLPEKV